MLKQQARTIAALLYASDLAVTLAALPAAYVHATEVGGTHPALVEAMGFGRPLAVHDTSENREVAGEAAVYFTARMPATLARALATLLSDSAERIRRGHLAAERARARYRWADVTDAYERLLAGS